MEVSNARSAVVEPVAANTDDGPCLRILRRVGLGLQTLPRSLAVVPALIWCAVIWKLSSLTPESIPDPVAWGGLPTNLLHAPEFGFLALLLLLAAPRRDGWPRVGRAEVVWVLVLVGAYGLIDEVHQSFTPGRDASLMDLVTDLTGASCVLWITHYLGRSEATERGLLGRFGLGIVLCAVAAAAATFAYEVFPDSGWV